MLDKSGARSVAMSYLLHRYPDAAKNWAIYEETVDRPYGWVFFYDHRRAVEEGDLKARLAGNGPILVERNGVVHHLGTAAPLEFYLQRLEAGGELGGE